ncbi:MAG TPA: phage tail assembly protein [Methylomirabilota bacterium]|nr:phage tail assembly protein [Methylomirabilota bacterium]
MSQEKVFKLKEPLQANGETITELKLKKPKAKALRAFDRAQGDIAGSFELISDLAGIPPSAVDELDVEDIAEIMAWVSGFFPKSLLGGKR